MLGSVLNKEIAKKMGIEGAIPPKDETFRLEGKIVIQEGEMLVEQNSPVWISSRKEFALFPRLSSFTSANVRNLWPVGNVEEVGKKHSSAVIQSSGRFNTALEPSIRPILIALRPLSPAFRQAHLEDMTITGKVIQIGNDTCFECREHRTSSTSTYSSYWLCEQSNYLPRRITMHHAGRTSLKIDIEYREHESKLPVPKAWRVTNTNPKGQMIKSIQGEMQSWKDKAETPICPPLPVNTHVIDERLPPGKQRYVVLEGADKYTITARDRGKSHHELVEEIAKTFTPLSTKRWISIVLTIALLTMMAMFIYLISRIGKRSS